MKSGAVVRACARHLNFRQGLLVPECVVDCSARGPDSYGFGQKRYQADLMWVTRLRFATEIEVKVTRSDWRADSAKRKWEYLPGWVTRFIYAVPEELGIPDFVMPQAGIWHIVPCANWGVRVKTVRAPKRIGKESVPDWLAERWMQHLHTRYWYQHLYSQRVANIPKAAKGACADGHQWMEYPPVVMPLRDGDTRQFKCHRCGEVRTTIHPDSPQRELH